MAARVPVVATDVSGSRELVRDGETGRIVPVGQPAALAEAMLWMLDHPDRACRMAEQARRQAQRFTIEHTAAGYDKLYQKVLGNQR
jgi:glycosyltransferase involved in cell wall biosynthesis